MCLVKEAANIAIHRVFDGEKLLRVLPAYDLAPPTEPVPDIPTDGVSEATPRLSPDELDPLSLIMDDLMQATKVVQPTAKREGFATAPDVSWKDVGALRDVRAYARTKCTISSVFRCVSNSPSPCWSRFDFLSASKPLVFHCPQVSYSTVPPAVARHCLPKLLQTSQGRTSSQSRFSIRPVASR